MQLVMEQADMVDSPNPILCTSQAAPATREDALCAEHRRNAEHVGHAAQLGSRQQRACERRVQRQTDYLAADVRDVTIFV